MRGCISTLVVIGCMDLAFLVSCSRAAEDLGKQGSTENATAGENEKVRPMSVSEEDRTLRVYGVPVVGLAILGDERTLVAVHQDGRLEEWNMDDGTRRKGPDIILSKLGIRTTTGTGEVVEGEPYVKDVVFTDDAKTIVCTLLDDPCVYDRVKGGTWAKLSLDAALAVPLSATIAADSQLYGVSGRGLGVTTFWNLQERKMIQDHYDGTIPSSIALSPNGKFCFAYDLTNGGRVWDLEKKLPQITLSGNKETVWTALWVADQQLATGGANGELLLWNIRTPSDATLLKSKLEHVDRMAFSPKRNLLACGWRGGNMVEVWDMKERVLRKRIDLHCHGVYALTFSKEGLLLGIGTADGAILVMKIEGSDSSGVTTKESIGITPSRINGVLPKTQDR